MNDFERDPAIPRRKKSLGQHFLNSGRVINRIVDSVAPEPGVTVIEIGPGRGALTRELFARSDSLILVEMDLELLPLLKQNFPTARIVPGDAAEIDVDELVPADTRAVVAGNLPYNAGGRILFNLLSRAEPFERLVLMFQKEVARRLCALPGDRDYGAVSALAGLLASTRYLFDVDPSKFVPPPKVISGVVLFTPRPAGPDSALLRSDRFQAFVHAVFAQPRKTIENSMMNGLCIGREKAARLLQAAGISPTIRPNGIRPDQLLSMYRIYAD